MKNASKKPAALGIGPASVDVLLAVSAVLLSAWAYNRGATPALDKPLAIGEAAADTTADLTIRIDRENAVHVGDRELAGAGLLDAELRQLKPRAVRVVASGDSLHVTLREVLTALERQGVTVARLEGAP